MSDKLPETLFANTVAIKSKGMFTKPVNRPLTNDDVKDAEYILLHVYADSAYPLNVEVPKDEFANIDQKNHRRVTYWYFQTNDFSEHLEKPNEPYGIVIGDQYSIHV